MNNNLSQPQELAADALRQVPFFANLPAVDINNLAKQLIVRRFSADQVIFHLGDPGGLLYIITDGKVKISRGMAEGQEAILAILGVGDFFGELALLDDSPRSATAKALRPTTTLTLHREQFTDFLNQNPDFAHHVLQTLARRIRHLNEQISDIFFLDVPARLARMLLQLADKHGRPVEDGIRIEFSLTQTDLAEMTGATRVSINRAVGRFRREKWIRVHNRTFFILNQQALQNLIEMSGG
jgi:CRP/FNR family transcriptional regulator, cyclic AMP receptor protein